MKLKKFIILKLLKSRIEVISKFKDIVDEDVKEKVLQKYIFDHLWLLDPSWKEHLQTPGLRNLLKKNLMIVYAKLTEEEKQGRIDIRYKTAAGKHIIIELKRYKRNVEVNDLNKQMSKYRNALNKCLRDKFPNEKE